MEVTSKSSLASVNKCLTLREHRGAMEEAHSKEKEIHRCRESVLAMKERVSLPMHRLENSLDVGRKKSQFYFLPMHVDGSKM